jgi:glycosyltransferase involved in cell wall biosynthesis
VTQPETIAPNKADFRRQSVAVVLPCYKSRQHVENVINGIPVWVDHIICVDDACPDGTTEVLEARLRNDPRIEVLSHEENQGVGGAVLTGWQRAAQLGADILVKIDSDGQMDGGAIAHLIAPIQEGAADYVKGNRFYNRSSFAGMPPFRIVANLLLTFASKLASGFWSVVDPLNGFVAVRTETFLRLNHGRIGRRYMFESDMLCQLNVAGAQVADVEMPAIYGEEISSFSASKHLGSFVSGYLRNAAYRIGVTYFVRDFSVGSLHLVVSATCLLLAAVLGIPPWIRSAVTGTPATAGTVILPALAAIFAVQSLLAFLQLDVDRGNRLQSSTRRFFERKRT